MARLPSVIPDKTTAGSVAAFLTERVCLGTQQFSALSSVTPSSFTVPDGALVAVVQADGGTVRLRIDGGTPTASVGKRIDDGSEMVIDSALSNVRLLAQSGSATNIWVEYFDRV